MITAAFLLAGVIIDIIRLHSAMITVTVICATELVNRITRTSEKQGNDLCNAMLTVDNFYQPCGEA